MGKRAQDPPKAHVATIEEARGLLMAHPLFSALLGLSLAWRDLDPPFEPDGFARLARAVRHWAGDAATRIELNAWRDLSPPQWAHVIAQALTHYHFCHDDAARQGDIARVASAILAVDFLEAVGIGQRPEELCVGETARLGTDAATIERRLREGGPDLVARFAVLGLEGPRRSAFVFEGEPPILAAKEIARRQDRLAGAIRASVIKAIDTAGAIGRGAASARRNSNSLAERARSWFVASFPLLAALASGFAIVEDADLCRRLDIAIAAVDAEAAKVYINPNFPWDYEKMKFVVAHELLHVGLRHEPRRQGRDPYLWNVACDYVINGWLVEMGVGLVPADGLMLDPELAFEKDSAEAIYDRITGDLRLLRRLGKTKTFRGAGAVDVISNRPPAWWHGPGTDLDTFYRNALAEGLDLHLSRVGRGTLPGEMMEEIRALQQKPIPWDVRLAQWLDAFFPPLEARRSYARPSRRQASTPDIPRAVWIQPEERMATRTFGVVLDTSGSMSQRLLAKGLGAIASYAMSRDVPMLRVVQCDAGVHDMGFVAPETLMGQVEVRGRCGTVLQPAIDKLQQDAKFPEDAPILVVTDGEIDHLIVKREHAYLMPEGARLPFRTEAPRFAFEKD